MQHIMSRVRKAVHDYSMISPGDRICVGLSGGKDSIALTVALANIRRFIGIPFGLCAVTVDLGLGADYSSMSDLCRDMGVEYLIEKTDIGQVVFDIRKESNPCSLCSKMRKGALHSAVKRLGCNKVALGHNNDDVVETFFLNLMFAGSINTFSPVSFLDRTQLTQIRPLIYARSHDVRSAVSKLPYGIVKNPCPADGNTRRQTVRDKLMELERSDHDLFPRLFGAICRAGIGGFHT